MKKNPIKSFVKSIVRVLWKYFLDPLFINLLPNSKPKAKLKNIGYRIERRAWWPKTPKPSSYIEYIDSTPTDPYLLSELQALGKIEFALQPSTHFLANLKKNQHFLAQKLESDTLGSQYQLLIDHIKELSYDVIFLAPWLKRGGADLGVLHHITAMHQKGYKTLLITTEKSDSPWANRLPQTATHLNLSLFTEKLSLEKKMELLARVVLQSKAQTIHNINSELGWMLYQHYGHQLRYLKKSLFASVFSEAQITESTYFGYSPAYISVTHTHISALFSDTKWYPKTQIHLTGLDDLFKTIYFPNQNTLSDYRANLLETTPILWASRIAPEKLPNLLYQIATLMPNQIFHIYGETENACKSDLEKLMDLPNVQYFGKYDSFAEISNTTQYKAFLYTTQYDGLPNVLIETISNGLPVIAYDVGGVSEIIHSDCLLNHNDSINDNIKKITSLLSDPETLKKSWQYSHDILKIRHSWEYFISSLESIDNYFPALTQDDYYEKHYENIRILSKPTIIDK